jgi:hypothetical protein
MAEMSMFAVKIIEKVNLKSKKVNLKHKKVNLKPKKCPDGNYCGKKFNFRKSDFEKSEAKCDPSETEPLGRNRAP